MGERRDLNKKAKKLRKDFALMKRRFEKFKFESNLSDTNPLVYLFFFVIGLSPKIISRSTTLRNSLIFPVQG